MAALAAGVMRVIAQMYITLLVSDFLNPISTCSHNKHRVTLS